MLERSTQLTAIAACVNLGNKGLTVVPGPNTLIYELTRLSVPAITPNLAHIDNLDERQNVFVDSFTRDYEDIHSTTQDDIVRQLAPMVSGHISFAKNVVNPIIIQQTEECIKFANDYRPVDPAANFNIVAKDFPEILNDESFLDCIKSHKGRNPSLAAETVIKLKLADQVNHQAMLTTGASSLDKLIKDWYVSLPEGFIENVWGNFFGPSASLSAFLNIERIDFFQQADVSLALYLFALHYSNEIPEDTGMTLSYYKSIIDQYLQFAGANLCVAIDRFKNFSNSKTFVIRKDKNTQTIVLAGAPYREWLAAGGKIEHILGLLVSEHQVYSAKSISDISNKLEAAWNSYYLFIKAGDRQRYNDSFKNFLKLSFAAGLRDLTEAEKEAATTNTNLVDIANRKAEDFIDHLPDDFISNIGNVVIELIAKCRFYYSAAFDILNDINLASKINPNIEPREAALLAVCNYISDYFAAQLAVK